MKNNLYYWLVAEAEVPAAQQAPVSDPFAPGQGGQIPPQNPPQNIPPGGDPSAATDEDDDVTQDPQSIEMPEEGRNKDFEQWRHDFMEMAVKADNEELIASLNSIRDMEGLEPAQRKFVEDNLQIFMYRRDANVMKASKEIRSLVKKDLDRTNPGTTLAQHLTTALNSQPILYQGLIKLSGTFGWKGDLHRKWVAAFLGAVQTGGGGTAKDLAYCEKDYDINLSTRFATQWGEINLGKWSLLSGDPKQYLKPDEQGELQDGSPEKKQVLRREIILKSVAEHFRKRAFIVHVVETDGTVYVLGWDLGNSLLDAYKTGKVVVRGQENEDKEILIGDDGNIIPVIDYDILFVQETGEVDDEGRPETEEVPFISRKDSQLYLTADLDTLKAASAGMSGMFMTSIPYGGNSGDIRLLQSAVPGLAEIINKQVV